MRQKYRLMAQVALIAAGLVCVLFMNGWVLTGRGMRSGPGIPMHWVGYAFIAYSALGFFGVNIFKGGPLDPARDPVEPDEEADDDTTRRGGPRPL